MYLQGLVCLHVSQKVRLLVVFKDTFNHHGALCVGGWSCWCLHVDFVFKTLNNLNVNTIYLFRQNMFWITVFRRLRAKFWPDCAILDTSMTFCTVVDHD